MLICFYLGAEKMQTDPIRIVSLQSVPGIYCPFDILPGGW